MFWNIYSKRILYSIRSKDTLIWTWIFPIMLATLFFATLSAVDTVGRLQEIPLGVIDDEGYRQSGALRSTLESVTSDSGGKLFNLSLLKDAAEADALLESKDINGYIFIGDPASTAGHSDPTSVAGIGIPMLVVGEDGLNQTIIRSVLDGFLQTGNAAGAVLAGDAAGLSAPPSLLAPVSYTKEISLSGNRSTDKATYFYALLAMVCLYGGFQGMTTVTLLQANLSPLGARRTMSPAGRFKLALYDLLGGITVHFVCLLIVLAYIVFVLGADFGSKFMLVLLTCFAGSLLGVSFGAAVSVTSKLKEQAKVAILICVTMICCFLSGLMTSGISYTVMRNAPAVAWLNPAARIADAFYCLYYYDNFDRFFLNIGIVFVMAAVLFTVTAVFIRRQRYESI